MNEWEKFFDQILNVLRFVTKNVRSILFDIKLQSFISITVCTGKGINHMSLFDMQYIFHHKSISRIEYSLEDVFE